VKSKEPKDFLSSILEKRQKDEMEKKVNTVDFFPDIELSEDKV